MAEQSYFPELLVAGEHIDLSHLAPFTVLISSKLAKRDLRIRVTFSNHCFSHGLGQIPDLASHSILDADSARPRAFCPTRYRLSHKLPKLIQSLNHPKAKVWETAAERNWCYSIAIKDPDGPYHVFFELRRASHERRQWQDLSMVVESAYHENESGEPRLKGSMTFLLLCGKVYLGQPNTTRR